MCYPPDIEEHHHSNVWLGILAVAGVVLAAVLLTADLRPSLDAQYFAGCMTGNVCKAGR